MLRVGRDAAQIADAVVQELSGIVGAEVEITLEIREKAPDSISAKLVRDVSDNRPEGRFSAFGVEPVWLPNTIAYVLRRQARY